MVVAMQSGIVAKPVQFGAPGTVGLTKAASALRVAAESKTGAAKDVGVRAASGQDVISAYRNIGIAVTDLKPVDRMAVVSADRRLADVVRECCRGRATVTIVRALSAAKSRRAALIISIGRVVEEKCLRCGIAASDSKPVLAITERKVLLHDALTGVGILRPCIEQQPAIGRACATFDIVPCDDSRKENMRAWIDIIIWPV